MTSMSIGSVSINRAVLLLAVCAMTVPALAQDGGGGLSPKQIAQRMLPGVVKIEVFDASGNLTGTGSGFTVRSDGIVVTNFHVIEKAHSARALLGNGNDKVSVLGAVEIDTKRDFAILKVQAVDLPTLTMGNSDRAEPGDEVIALGAPLGLTGSVSTGIVSHVRDWKDYRVVQHTAPISPGSSGGPLLNRTGEVIGVNTFGLESGNSLFFAIPVNYVRASLQNSDGRWVGLQALQAALAKAREQELIAQRKELLEKAFAPYDDPQSLFSVLAPRSWRVERSEYQENDTRHVVVMFSSATAEQARIGAWLSEGIRVHLRLPARGRTWNLASAGEWRDRQFDGMLSGYSKHKAGKRESTRLGGMDAWEQVVAGVSDAISKPELGVLLVATDPQCLLSVEIVVPADQKEVLDMAYQVVKQTFRAKWTGR